MGRVVNLDKVVGKALVKREGKYYLPDENKPFWGLAYAFDDNGVKREKYYKNGFRISKREYYEVNDEVEWHKRPDPSSPILLAEKLGGGGGQWDGGDSSGGKVQNPRINSWLDPDWGDEGL